MQSCLSHGDSVATSAPHEGEFKYRVCYPYPPFITNAGFGVPNSNFRRTY